MCMHDIRMLDRCMCIYEMCMIDRYMMYVYAYMI